MVIKSILSKREKESIDILKGLSCLLVIITHTVQVFYGGTLYYSFKFVSQPAVMVFFVLSGFLIFQSIQKNIINNDGEFNFFLYLKDRAIRIYPPFIFLLIFMTTFSLIISFIFEVPNYFSIKEFLFYILFTNGFLVGMNFFNTSPWSLSIEFWSYILGGLFFLRNRLSLLLIFLFIPIGLYLNSSFIYSFVWFLSFIFGFLKIKDFNKKIILLVFLGFVINLLIMFIHFYFFRITRIYVLASGFSFLFLMILLLNLNLFHLRGSLLKRIAPYSYTWYLFHMPFLNISKEFLGFTSRPFQIIVALFVGWVVSKALAFYLEDKKWVSKVFLEKRNHFFKNPKNL